LKKKQNRLFYFIVGEPSGDLHASQIIKELKKQSNSSVSFRGLGGPLMQKEGFFSLENFNRLSVMGFVEILKELLFFIKLQKKIIVDIKKTRPDKVVLVDYPGFNLRLAKKLSKVCDIPIVYYISPQFWAWKEKRVNVIKKCVQNVIVIFPFEVSWYKQRGLAVNYFGHPLIDLYKKQITTSARFSVGLFIGSRKQEIKKHAPVVRDVIKQLKKKIDNVFFIVGTLKDDPFNVVGALGLQSNYKIVYDSFRAFDESKVAIVASGTATLECAITKTPFVVIYKTSFISWLITRSFVKIKFASIVNILANKLIVGEYLQKDCNAEIIVKNLMELVSCDTQSLFLDFQSVINKLGNGSAYKQTSSFLLKK